MFKIHFRPLPVLTVAAVIGLAILLRLGFWQLDRLDWKIDLIERLNARTTAEPVALEETLAAHGAAQEAEFRRVIVTGRFDHANELHLFGAVVDGEAGYSIITPLIREGAAPVLINRGFVPARRKDAAERADGQIEGPVTITGPVRLAEPPNTFVPEADPVQNIWYRRDLTGMTAAAGLDDPAPVYVDAEARVPGGPLGGGAQITLRNNHLAYAWTWFIFAACLVGVYLAFHITQGRLRIGPAGHGGRA